MGDFLRSQGIDEQGDQPTIRSSAPEHAAVESLPEPCRREMFMSWSRRAYWAIQSAEWLLGSARSKRWSAEDRETRGWNARIVIDKPRRRRGRPIGLATSQASSSCDVVDGV